MFAISLSQKMLKYSFNDTKVHGKSLILKFQEQMQVIVKKSNKPQKSVKVNHNDKKCKL